MKWTEMLSSVFTLHDIGEGLRRSSTFLLKQLHKQKGFSFVFSITIFTLLIALYTELLHTPRGGQVVLAAAQMDVV